jgi:serine/threonine protein phosphatase PrpC
MTKDHVASCLKERERVIKAGTEVKWQIDTWRVGTAALQVTRSIGDDDLKPAVTAQPEVIETALSEDDEFLVGFLLLCCFLQFLIVNQHDTLNFICLFSWHLPIALY